MLSNLVSYFKGEYNELASVTEPNQVMSISEIMERFAMGMNASVNDGGLYDEDQSDEFEDDVTRDPGFDFAAADELERQLEARKEIQRSEHIDENEQGSNGEVRAETEPSEQLTESKSKNDG